MSDQLAALNAALGQARAAAENAVPPTAGVPAVGGAATPGTNVVSMPVSPGRAVSMREMVAESGMGVKTYLKVDKPGFTIGSDTSVYHKEIEVEFRLSEAKAFYGVRFGNPAKYLRSFDRLVETRSKRPWADVVAEAQRLDPRCRGDYRGVDIPFAVMRDIADASGKVLIETGEKLGFTSSITNWQDWVNFITPYFNLMDAGQLSEDALVRGKIVHAQRKDANNVWGAVTFVDFAIIDNGIGDQAQAA